jgi:uncharacterized repeat protein (TIGR01451 family)
LNADALNPLLSSSGVFGGEVLALQLNVDYNDAGVLASGGASLGNLVYMDATSPLNGMTVRQILALANSALGGANISASGVTISSLNALLDNLNNAFADCKISNWALTYLVPSAAAVPVPGAVTASDGCDSHPVLTYSDNITQGGCAGGYTILRTWKAVDASGNAATCVQVISQISSNSSICGTVSRDCGGGGLAGVIVTLKNYFGVTVGATATDSKGGYCFTQLSAGSYVVAVQPPIGYAQTTDPDSIRDNQTTVVVAACQGKSGVNFGYSGMTPAIRLVKRGPATAAVGDKITYTFTVTNTGNACFSSVQVSDPMLGGVIFTQSGVAAGQVIVFSKTYTVKATDAGYLNNVASVVGTPTIGNPVSTFSTWAVFIFAPPTGLAATLGDTMVALHWNPIANAISYNVKRSTINGGPYVTIQTGLTGTNFTDVAVTNGVPYYYVVSDVTANGESPNSAQVSAIPAAPLPSPWNTSDIGAVAAVGGANYNNNNITNGSFTVIG